MERALHVAVAEHSALFLRGLLCNLMTMAMPWHPLRAQMVTILTSFSLCVSAFMSLPHSTKISEYALLDDGLAAVHDVESLS